MRADGSRLAVMVLALLPACGRVAFDAVGDGAIAPGDATDATDGPAVCAHLFCDDLEDPALAAWGGVLADPGGTATRDPTVGYHGGSLRATSPSGTAMAALYVDPYPAVLPSDQWARVMLYAKSTSALEGEPVVFTNAAGSREIVFAIFDTDTDIHAHSIAGDFNLSMPLAPPRDQWVCYELHVTFGQMGAVELFRDGALLLRQPAIDTRPASGNLSRLLVGIGSKPTTFAETLWIDEVVADTSRIGCPP